MKRRGPLSIDYGHDRARWADLIRAVHATAEAPSDPVLRALADLAGSARNTWLPFAAYPDGLIAPLLATAALAYARHPEGERRQRLGVLMIEAAGMADEALAATAPAAAMARIAPGAGLAVRGVAVRAPYADN